MRRLLFPRRTPTPAPGTHTSSYTFSSGPLPTHSTLLTQSHNAFAHSLHPSAVHAHNLTANLPASPGLHANRVPTGTTYTTSASHSAAPPLGPDAALPSPPPTSFATPAPLAASAEPKVVDERNNEPASVTARGGTVTALAASNPAAAPPGSSHYYVWSSKMSRARVYPDVNVKRPREYWDYESLVVNWGYVATCAFVCLLSLSTAVGRRVAIA